jgi:hypothetical protein
MLPAVAGLFLALLAVLLVLEPLLRAARGERIVNTSSLLVDDDEDDDPLGDRKGRALVALREIEFDKATGKLSDEDYQKLYDRYSAEALAAMNDGLADGRTDGDAIERMIAEARGAAPRGAKKFCETCGSKLEGSGRFCVECGVRVQAA